jgi:hypothetical protein
VEFRRRFPNVKIVDPPTFLAASAASRLPRECVSS